MKTPDVILLPSRYYHIYNRGNNGENIFYEAKNYSYFLTKWAKHIEPIAETHACCLLKNHFHFLIKIREEQALLEHITANYPPGKAKKLQAEISRYLSYQFAHCFNGYAQAMNRAYHRTGTFFEERFERKEVDSDKYFQNLIHYIHKNPEKHGFVTDFRDYPHSSYNAHISLKPTLLMRETVLSWFGNTDHFQEFHQAVVNEKGIEDLIIEKD